MTKKKMTMKKVGLWLIMLILWGMGIGQLVSAGDIEVEWSKKLDDKWSTSTLQGQYNTTDGTINTSVNNTIKGSIDGQKLWDLLWCGTTQDCITDTWKEDDWNYVMLFWKEPLT